MQHLVLYTVLLYTVLLEPVFQLLVRLQFMYLQYNMYLSAQYIHAHDPKQSQMAGFAHQLGCKMFIAGIEPVSTGLLD